MPTLQNIVTWLDGLADVFAANKDLLTGLDAAIGDADHGINMARGFAAVRTALAAKAPDSIAAACKTTSLQLIKTVGGASGPLYGTWFMKAGPLLPGDQADVAAFAAAAAAGVAGIMKMGKSGPGEKTMLEAWLPAVDALKTAVGASEQDAFAQMAKAAEGGMKSTIPLRASKGRASYLGERSIGHQDPGATSTFLMLSALAASIE